jgi:hypothetical protein
MAEDRLDLAGFDPTERSDAPAAYAGSFKLCMGSGAFLVEQFA